MSRFADGGNLIQKVVYPQSFTCIDASLSLDRNFHYLSLPHPHDRTNVYTSIYLPICIVFI